MSLTCYEEIGRVGRGCYDDATRKLLPWNLSFTETLIVTLAFEIQSTLLLSVAYTFPKFHENPL